MGEAMSNTLDEILRPWLEEAQSEYGTGHNDHKKRAFIEIETAKQQLLAEVLDMIGEGEDLSVFGDVKTITDIAIMEDYAHMKGRNHSKTALRKAAKERFK